MLARLSALALLFVALPAHAQTVSNTVNSATRTVNGAVGGIGGGGSTNNPYAALNDPSNVGGTLPGGMKLKYGNKEIRIKGAVGVGDDQKGFRGGASIPF